MILYHGTYLDFDQIDLAKCAPYKDFGTGFYTTEIFEQAKAMAIQKSKLFGGAPCVLSYETDDGFLSDVTFPVKVFPETSEEWAKFIINNRNYEFTDFASPLCNRDNKYEIVMGPVANDTLTTLIRRYQRGYIDSAILLKEMKYVAPTNQYSFHTERAVRLLKMAGIRWIT